MGARHPRRSGPALPLSRVAQVARKRLQFRSRDLGFRDGHAVRPQEPLGTAPRSYGASFFSTFPRHIRQLLGRRASPGMSVGDWLGFDGTCEDAGSEDRPRVVDDDELADALGSRPPGLRGRLERSHYLKRQPDGLWLIRSPALLDLALQLQDAGVEVELTAQATDLLRRRLARAVDDLIVLFAGRTGARFGGRASNGRTGRLAPCPAPHRSRGSRDHSRPRGRAERTAGSPPGRAHLRSPSLSEKHTTSTLTPEPNHRTAGHPSGCTTSPAGSCFLRRRRERERRCGAQDRLTQTEIARPRSGALQMVAPSLWGGTPKLVRS